MSTAEIITLVVSIASLFSSVAAIVVTRQLGRRAELGMAQWLRDLRDWAGESIDVLVKATYAYSFSAAETGRQEQLRELASHLSVQIERGRFFLPNQQRDEYRTDKLPGYRGFRHSVLDALVASVRLLDGEYIAKAPASVLLELRKKFISDVSEILAPEAHNHEIARLISTSYTKRATDHRGGKLLPNTIPAGAKAAFDEAVARAEKEQSRYRRPL